MSVVIPAYNAAVTLDDALKSIQHASNPLEVIVVDDGSTDDTAVVAKSFPDIRLIRARNGGAARARNIGIEASHGEFIVFLDADDRWLSGRLDGMLNLFTVDDDVEIVCCDFMKSRDGVKVTSGFEQHRDGVAMARRISADILVWDNAFEALCRSLFVSTSTAVVRTASVRRLGGFDERFSIAEDMDLWLSLAREGKVAAKNRILVDKRDTLGSLGSDQDRVLTSTNMMLASFSRRRGALTGSQRRALRRRRSELYRGIGYCARCRGARLQACQSYISSLALNPSRRAARGLLAALLAPNPTGET
ncbi:glycosyltransferase family 2 protein [Nitrococcus mobilis]|uniref:glycosyltransferase family 2 protein n=1 Tax=Nitrococcus mobilis TaxID=35797 RepID=UPI001E59E2CD|nr:glycosyltransferase family 2 protein [Nitrococcus mobilis]